MKTAKEVFEECTHLSLVQRQWNEKDIIRAMEIYASQFKSPDSPSKVERMTLQECKDRIANDFGIEKWVHITPRYSAEKMMVLMDEAAELYASQFKSPDSPLNPSTEILMRTDCDCMVACLAMLMGWSYEQAADYFPPRAVKETGYTWDFLVPYLRVSGVRLIWYGKEVNNVDWSRPAMVDVPSLTAPYKGDHIIFWDGRKVIDPSRKPIKYTKLPSEILNVYQLKP